MTASSYDKAMQDRIAQAEAAVAALAEQFLPCAQAEMQSLRTHLTQARTAPGANAISIRQAFEIMHVIKGQGGSFGFPLISELGEPLCVLLRDEGDRDLAQLDVIDEHVRVLSAVVDEGIKGDGGDLGRQLVEKLRSITEREAA